MDTPKIDSMTTSQPPSSKVSSFFDSIEGFLGRRKKYVPLTPVEILPGIMSNDGVATVFQLDTRKPRTAKEAAKRAASASAAHSSKIDPHLNKQKPSTRTTFHDACLPPYPLSPKELKGKSFRAQQASKNPISKQKGEPSSPTDRLIVRHANPFTGLLSRNQTELNIPNYLSTFKKGKDMSKGTKYTNGIEGIEQPRSKSPPYPHSKTPSASTPNLTIGQFIEEVDDLVPMPSVHEPAPFTFPGATAAEIETYERAIQARTENIARNMNVDLPAERSTFRSRVGAHSPTTKPPYPNDESGDHSFLAMGGLDQAVHQENLGIEHYKQIKSLLDRQHHQHNSQATAAMMNTKPKAHREHTEHFPLEPAIRLNRRITTSPTPLTKSALRKHQKHLAKLEQKKSQEKTYNTSIYTSIPPHLESQSTEDTHILIPLGMIQRECWSRQEDMQLNLKMKKETEGGNIRKVKDGQSTQLAAASATGNRHTRPENPSFELDTGLDTDEEREKKLADWKRKKVMLLRTEEEIPNNATISTRLGSRKRKGLFKTKEEGLTQERVAKNEDIMQSRRKDSLDLSSRVLEKFRIGVSKPKEAEKKVAKLEKAPPPTSAPFVPHRTSIHKPINSSARKELESPFPKPVLERLKIKKQRHEEIPMFPGAFTTKYYTPSYVQRNNDGAIQHASSSSSYVSDIFSFFFPFWGSYYYSKTREILKYSLQVLYVLILAWFLYFLVDLGWFIVDWWIVVIWPIRCVFGMVGWIVGSLI